MKKGLLYILLAVIGLIAGCKKDTDPIFDDPDSRLSAELQADQEKLLSAENGWKAVIYPKGGKGFTYYFKFTADGKVVMLSDFNTSTASAPAESTYRLKALQRPTLIFDTYNYIHLPSDPDAALSGGTDGKGLTSDFEFAFVRSTADSLIMEGIFNGNVMKMTKLTASESEDILAGGLKDMINQNAAYIVANRNPYLVLGDERKLALVIDGGSRTLKLNYTDDQNNVQSQAVTFAYGVNTIVLNNNITYGSVSFNELLFDPANKAYYIMVNNTRVNVQNSPVPLTPLKLIFGYPNTFAYRKISLPNATLPPGVTSAFTAIFNTVKSNFSGTGRTVTSAEISLTSNTGLRITVNYSASGTNYTAYVDYTCVRNDDIFTLSAPVLSSNWSTRATQLKPLTDFMLSGPFKIDWVASSDPDVLSALGGFYRVDDPASFFYGYL